MKFWQGNPSKYTHFSWKAVHFRWVSQSNWSFQSRKKISGNLCMLRSYVSIIRIDFQQNFRPKKYFHSGDFKFFTDVLRSRKIQAWYDNSAVFYRKALLREFSSELISFRVFWPEIDCSGGARCKPRESKETRVVAQTMPESAQHFQNVLSNVLQPSPID